MYNNTIKDLRDYRDEQKWCWDLYDEKIYGPYSIFRGGSWVESVRGCGSTSRPRGHPTFSIDDLGFRLAKSI